MCSIRKAEKFELSWINACYDTVEFIHSNFDNEIIAIAEIQNQKAGLGRLVQMDAENLELGGMYVFEAFRNQGVARKIVEYLLGNVGDHQTVYCIPFEHLTRFYQQFCDL